MNHTCNAKDIKYSKRRRRHNIIVISRNVRGYESENFLPSYII